MPKYARPLTAGRATRSHCHWRQFRELSALLAAVIRWPALEKILRWRRFDDFGNFVGAHAAVENVPLDVCFRACALDRLNRARDDGHYGNDGNRYATDAR